MVESSIDDAKGGRAKKRTMKNKIAEVDNLLNIILTNSL
ncbi:MAG: hypothetical protein BAJATHORv1_30014 [Candidatus Thorarchaeota archaeon]|nr:MAG: hypothetical protein BAJATHORv1_30014 [Candidatus Thorarchaeota archaeon]